MGLPKLLMAHPWMGRGGSEAAAAWATQALQDDYEVTFVTSSPLDWDDINSIYGTRVDAAKVKYLWCPPAPTVRDPVRLSHLQRNVVERFCRRIADDFDVCFSAYNPIYFGRPGIQLIGDFSFSEEMRKRLYVHGESKFCHRASPVRDLYVSVSDHIGGPKPRLCQRGDLVLANSQWSARQLADCFDLPRADVIYPPVVLPKAPAESNRDPLGFVCLGRIVPEKEIERMIKILTRVRESGYPVTLRLIGALDDSAYSRSLAKFIEPLKDWVSPTGYLTLDDKQEILSTQTYAIHGCRIEAFGIAVAEMASMGCVPFVPSSGGAGEIVGHPELQYSTDDEAVEKILSFLSDPSKAEEVRASLPLEMQRFGPEVFMNDVRKSVLGFLDPEISSSNHAAPCEDITPVV